MGDWVRGHCEKVSVRVQNHPMEILSLFQHEQHRRETQKQDRKTFPPQSCPTRSLKGTRAMHGRTPKHTQPTYRVFNLISTQARKLSPPAFFLPYSSLTLISATGFRWLGAGQDQSSLGVLRSPA